MHAESSGLKIYDNNNYSVNGEECARNDLTIKNFLGIQWKSRKATASIMK